MITKDKLIKKFKKRDTVNFNTLLGPMVISKEKKIIYFHIAKTGGSSIVKLLRENKCDDLVLSNRAVSEKDKFYYFDEVAENWDQYYKFTFVRNKFSQLVSLYHYDLQGGHLSDFTKNKSGNVHATFDDFIRYYVQPSKDELYDYWIDQHFLTTIDNSNIFDFVGRFENYKSDIKKVCKRLNLTYEDYRENIGKYSKEKNIAKYYTQDLEKIVRNKFNHEFEMFNWNISDNKSK